MADAEALRALIGTLPPVVQPKNEEDALLIDNLMRASLGGDSLAIDRARMALRQRMNELRAARGVAPSQGSSTIGEALERSGLGAYIKDGDLAHMHAALRFVELMRTDGVKGKTCG